MTSRLLHSARTEGGWPPGATITPFVSGSSSRNWSSWAVPAPDGTLSQEEAQGNHARRRASARVKNGPKGLRRGRQDAGRGGQDHGRHELAVVVSDTAVVDPEVEPTLGFDGHLELAAHHERDPIFADFSDQAGVIGILDPGQIGLCPRRLGSPSGGAAGRSRSVESGRRL